MNETLYWILLLGTLTLIIANGMYKLLQVRSKTKVKGRGKHYYPTETAEPSLEVQQDQITTSEMTRFKFSF